MQLTRFFLAIAIACFSTKAFSQITFERYYDVGGPGDIEQAYCVQPTFDGGYVMSCRKGQGGATKLMVLKVDSAGI